MHRPSAVGRAQGAGIRCSNISNAAAPFAGSSSSAAPPEERFFSPDTPASHFVIIIIIITIIMNHNDDNNDNNSDIIIIIIIIIIHGFRVLTRFMAAMPAARLTHLPARPEPACFPRGPAKVHWPLSA